VTAERGLFGDLDAGAGARGAPKRAASARPKRAPRERSPASNSTRGASLWADVAVNRPMRCEFTYAVPDELAGVVATGARVAVPFGPQRVVGVVTALREQAPDLDARRVRWLSRVLDEEPVVGPELFELTRWIAERWACSWGEALAAVLPGSLKHETGRKRVAIARATDGVGVKYATVRSGGKSVYIRSC
jgi:primosomal protein N' (replication factor Y)